MSDESVSVWLEALKQGDEAAAGELWDRFFGRLVALGRRILPDAARAQADEEDVAISAFKSLCLRARAGRFPQLKDRDELWKLLVTICVRKALRASRKSRREAGEEAFVREQLSDGGPTPDFVAQVQDTIDNLLSRLRDTRLREVALAKLEGLSNAEIAARQGRSISFVERKLQLIRQVWGSEPE